MLTELYIENFALIDKLTVAFAPGLNVLTGETGAGKSIIIDAINVLLGERAGTDLVRTGTSRAVVQAVFELADTPQLLPALAELGIEPDDGVLILSREVAREGRNLARVNGRSYAVSALRQVGDLLVDLHGQHEHQALLREEHHRAFLDALGDDDFLALQDAVAQLVRQRNVLLAELQALRRDERERLRALDLLSFQVQEIEGAQLTPDEETALSAERTRLANAEKLHEAAAAAYHLLYGGDDGPSVLDALGEAEMQLAGLARVDPALALLVTMLQGASEQISECCHELSDYQEHAQFDPERLEEVEERLALIGTLKRKYGENIEAILSYGARQHEELDRLTHHAERCDEATAELARVNGKLADRALALSAARATLAATLAAGVTGELAQLGMPKALFIVNITRQPQADGLLVEGETVAVTTHGVDLVSFFISANVGEPPKPLAKVASGGELSRVMLALKAVSARGSGVPTLIFDEIDSGIGGRTAEAVGVKLAQVARGAQVLCVTHLAQLAYYADRHFLIEKATAEGRTTSGMHALEAAERIEELARLHAGGRVTESVRDHVRGVLADIHGQPAQHGPR